MTHNKNNEWVNQDVYQVFLNFHTERLMKSTYKDEAIFHWRQILFYNSDFSENFGAPDLAIKEIYNQARQRLPLLAEKIDKYKLMDEA